MPKNLNTDKIFGLIYATLMLAMLIAGLIFTITSNKTQWEILCN